MKIKVISLLAVTIFITACSTPKENVSDIAEEVCSLIKNNDLDDIQDYFKSTVSTNQFSNPKGVREKFDCTVTRVVQKDRDNFNVEFKSFYIIKVEDIDGDFKVKGMSLGNTSSKRYIK